MPRLVRSRVTPSYIEQAPKVDHGKNTIGYTQWTPAKYKCKHGFGSGTHCADMAVCALLQLNRANAARNPCKAPSPCGCPRCKP